MIDDVDNKWRFHAKRKSSPKIQSSDRGRKLTGFLGNSNFLVFGERIAVKRIFGAVTWTQNKTCLPQQLPLSPPVSKTSTLSLAKTSSNKWNDTLSSCTTSTPPQKTTPNSKLCKPSPSKAPHSKLPQISNPKETTPSAKRGTVMPWNSIQRDWLQSPETRNSRGRYF